MVNFPMNYYNRSSNPLAAIPPITRNLILINFVIFLLQNTTGNTLNALFSISLTGILDYRFVWQPFTYMFLHGDFGHIFFNMLTLFFFGSELENTFGQKEYLKYYLFSGLGAGIFIFLFDLLMNHLGVPTGRTLGASGAIFGLLLAYALNFPDRAMYFMFVPIPIKAKYMVLGYAAISFFLLFGQSGGGVSHSGHMGGFLAGYILFRLNKRNFVYRPGNNSIDSFFVAFGNIIGFSKLKNIFSKKANRTNFGKPGRPIFTLHPSPNKNLNPDNMTDEEIERTIDSLLDKISAKGIKSLTIEQQLFLDKVSLLYRHKFPQ